MARVALPAISVTLGFTDHERTRSNMRIHSRNPLFATVATIAIPAYLNFINGTLTPAVQALSNAPINYRGVTFRWNEAVQASWGDGEVEKKGVFRFMDSQGRPSFAMAIPGIKESLLAPNGRDINIANATVAAYIAAMVGNGIACCTPNGLDLKSLKAGDAYKQHRQSLGGRPRYTG